MIVPISLENDIEVVLGQVKTAKERGAVRIHIDIIDGLYADNITIAPADLQAVDFLGMELDLHLLVDDPVEWLPECVALSPKRIYAQIEKMGSIEYFITALKEHRGIQVGLGIDLPTHIEAVRESEFELADEILLMSVKAGWSGQDFDPTIINKIKKLRTTFTKEIFVDGGINPKTYKQVTQAGATEAGANTAYWRGDFNEVN